MALVAGLVTGLVGYWLLASALYTHAFTHPGCGEMGVVPTDAGIEDTRANKPATNKPATQEVKTDLSQFKVFAHHTSHIHTKEA